MKPVHHKIKEALLKRLREVPLESQLPSDRELAREYNVALLTINRVMRDLSQEGYVVRKPRLGTFLASRERTVATSDERQSGAGRLVLAYPNFFSHHYWRHVQLAEELALKNGLSLVEYKMNPGTTADKVVNFAQQQANLRGLLVLPAPGTVNAQALARYDGLGKPVVLLSTAIDITAQANLHCFDFDWFRVGWLAIDALLRAGHRRVAWINHEPGRSDDIAKGMRQALRDHGLSGSDLLTVGHGIEAWEDSRSAGWRLAGKLIDEGGATGAYVDSLAGVRGALRALWERGKRAPEDLSIITNGNQSGDEDFSTPPVTTVDGDWDEEMRRAFAVVLSEVPVTMRAQTIPVRLRERSSIMPLNRAQPAP